MLDNIIEVINLIILVSAIGSFVTLMPLFKTLNKTQKIWLAILLVSLAISFFVDGVPDIINGFKTGFKDGVSGN